MFNRKEPRLEPEFHPRLLYSSDTPGDIGNGSRNHYPLGSHRSCDRFTLTPYWSLLKVPLASRILANDLFAGVTVVEHAVLLSTRSFMVLCIPSTEERPFAESEERFLYCQPDDDGDLHDADDLTHLCCMPHLPRPATVYGP